MATEDGLDMDLSGEEDIEDCVSFSSDSSDDDILDFTPTQRSNWRNVQVEDDTPVQLSDFYGLQGLNPEFDQATTVSDFVNLFLTEELINTLATNTNIRAEIYQRENEHEITEKSRANTWRPVTINEMKKCIAIILLSGILKKPRLNAYWSTNDMILTPFFHSCLFCFSLYHHKNKNYLLDIHASANDFFLFGKNSDGEVQF